MKPSEIFDLIVKADDVLKYATEDKVPARIRQARDLLTRAKEEAEGIGNRPLVEQADRRLADLEGLERGETEGETRT
ncbi:MAG: hypothetical protein ACRDGU_03210 [Actinomycetota bacterium]